MSDIRVPKLNNNDPEYIVLDWLADEGAAVRPGDPVVTLETSKAVEELAAEAAGLLHRTVPAGAPCAPDQVIGTIVASADELAAASANGSSGPAPGTGPLVTGPAQALIDEHGIDPARVRGLGIPLVRSGDIEALLAPDPELGEEHPALPPVQRAVAAAVTHSWRTIPAAFTAIEVHADPALARAKRLSREVRALVGLPELLVRAIAGLRREFPMCFSGLTDEQRVRPSDAAHVGVTMDAGQGLYVPVVRDADRLTVKEIADTVMRFRKTALRGGFTEAELAGGNILLALNTDANAVLAVPIVFPGQACAVSLCAPRPELFLAADGSVAERTVVTVGLAYDHRLVNGREALLFLRGLGQALEGGTES